MDVKEHYAALLGLGDEWSVSSVSLDLEHRRIDIFLRYLPPSAICPVCGRLAAVRDQLEERTWRHLDTMQFATLIHARTPRVDCPGHGAKVIELPWASKHSRFTLLFEAFAIEVLRTARSVKDAGALLRLNWQQTHSIMQAAVKRGMARRTEEEVAFIGMDEKSFRRGQGAEDYLCVLTDLERHRVLDVGVGRSGEGARQLIGKALTPWQCGMVCAAAIDMSAPFEKSLREALPEADIVFDRFHVQKHLNEGVDATRRQECRRMAGRRDKRLAGTLWTNLAFANGTTAERAFDELARLTNLVNRADAGVLSSFALTVDDGDRRTGVLREDGTSYAYGYDAIGQLTNASATLPDGTPWSGYQFSYSYGATGNPVEQNKNGLVHSNSFNNLNQNVASVPGGTLTVMGKANHAAGTATVNNVQAQMAPDGTFAAPGVQFQLGTNTLNWAFTDAFGRSTNRTSSVTVLPKTFGYDLNGNMTNDTRFAYEWDCENRLVAVRDAATGALVQSNRYDALWRRREKVDYAPDGTATTNRYIYKGWLVLAITDGEGNVLETYTHGADLSGEVGGSAGGIGGILASTQAGGAAFYAYDFNGNIVGATSSNQSVLATLAYTPFGEVLARTGPFIPRYQFSTKEFSSRTGLNYYGYRYYAPRLGRWMTRDPIEEDGGANLYNYLGNASLNNWDGLGLRGLPPPSPPSSIGGLVNLFCTIVNGIWTCKNNYNYDTYNARAVENCQNARQLWNAENRDNLSCACTKDGIPTPPRHCCRIEIVGIQSRLSMDAPIEWINGTSTFFSCTTCADAPHYDSPPSLGSPDFDYKYIVYYLDM